MDALPNPRGLLTVADTARLTGLSVPTIKRAILAGEIPVVTVLRRRYVPMRELDKLLAGIPVGGPSEEPQGRARGEVLREA